MGIDIHMPGTFTRRDYDLLPEGFPAELIDGWLLKDPAPTYGHQRVASRIRFALVGLLGPDRVPDTPADVALDDRNVFQPDIVALSSPAIDGESTVGIPVLVVEVLSPATCERDRSLKAGRLLDRGVREVWLVDPDERSIEVRRAGESRTVRGSTEIRSQAVEGFVLVPDALFSPARSTP